MEYGESGREGEGGFRLMEDGGWPKARVKHSVFLSSILHQNNRPNTSNLWLLTFFPFLFQTILGRGSPVAWQMKDATPPCTPVWSLGVLKNFGGAEEREKERETEGGRETNWLESCWSDQEFWDWSPSSSSTQEKVADFSKTIVFGGRATLLPEVRGNTHSDFSITKGDTDQLSRR